MIVTLNQMTAPKQSFFFLSKTNVMNSCSKIIHFEDDGFEMYISVESIGEGVLEDNATLKEIVDLALSKGYSRFVGTSGEYNEEPDFVFIFSKPNYSDQFDCLVRNPNAISKISNIIEEMR